MNPLVLVAGGVAAGGVAAGVLAAAGGVAGVLAAAGGVAGVLAVPVPVAFCLAAGSAMPCCHLACLVLLPGNGVFHDIPRRRIAFSSGPFRPVNPCTHS